MATTTRRKPGEIRDAIVTFLKSRRTDASVQEIHDAVTGTLGSEVAQSSVRSYLQIGQGIQRTARGRYRWAGRR